MEEKEIRFLEGPLEKKIFEHVKEIQRLLKEGHGSKFFRASGSELLERVPENTEIVTGYKFSFSIEKILGT